MKWNNVGFLPGSTTYTSYCTLSDQTILKSRNCCCFTHPRQTLLIQSFPGSESEVPAVTSPVVGHGEGLAPAVVNQGSH